MLLVHENKNRPGKWEVAWMWLPHFLAADQELHKLVDQKMTEKFRGVEIDKDLPDKMHQHVIDIIMDRYPINGLRRFLDGYSWFNAEDLLARKEANAR